MPGPLVADMFTMAILQMERVRHAYLRRVVAPAMRGMGARASSAIGRRVARGVFDLNPPARARAESRLRSVLTEATPTQISTLALSSFEHLGRFWSEALFVPRRMASRDWRRFVGIEKENELESLASAGRGVVFAGAYHGNIAVAACALGQIFKPIHVVVDQFAQPQLASWQRDLYSQPGIEPVDRRNAGHVVPRVLSSGGAVLLVGEHERHRGRGVQATFLGRSVPRYPTLGRLSRWFDVPVATITCRRESRPFSFRLELHDVLRAESACSSDDLVRASLASLEAGVMASPEQYYWGVPV